MKITVRKATIKDAPGIVAMWEELRQYHDRFEKDQIPKMKKNAAALFRKHVLKIIRAKNSAIHVAEVRGNVAEVRGKLVGYSLLRITKNPPIFTAKRVGVFDNIYVKAGRRGKGIASLLKNEGIKWLKQKGAEQAAIKIIPNNRLAHLIYKKWDF